MVWNTSLPIHGVCSNYFFYHVFHINVLTTTPMVAFVFFSQVGVSAFSNNIMISKVVFSSKTIYRFLNILVSFYDILELGFFQLHSSVLCFSSDL